jgi:hypothetical protein
MIPTRMLSRVLLSLPFACALWATPAFAQFIPSGPPGPTRPLVEPRIPLPDLNQPLTFPITINQSGSYYLIQNISGVSGEHGIVIQSDDVTLDLNGFTITGVEGSLSGITSTPDKRTNNIRLLNGSVRFWGESGIAAVNINFSEFSNLRVLDNAQDGMQVGDRCIVLNCIASTNGAKGIAVGFGSSINHCIASNNTLDGILASTGSTVSHCSSRANEDGYLIDSGSIVSNCSAIDNRQHGIHLIASIPSGRGSIVENCWVGRNALNGIHVEHESFILNNNCIENNDIIDESSGIFVNGSGNRIENNNVAGNNKGINVIGNGNIIIKNSASNNTSNYTIPSGNAVGPFVNAASINSNNNPSANYEY